MQTLIRDGSVKVKGKCEYHAHRERVGGQNPSRLMKSIVG